MKKERADLGLSDKEAAKRRDETIRRMIATPPKPHEPLKATKKAAKKRPKKKT